MEDYSDEAGIGAVNDFRASYEECRAEATPATSPSGRQQWLLFAEKWLKQAEAAEDQQCREAAIATAIPAK